MLENLHKIEWSKLSHAYGSASDVPGLLLKLTSTNEEVLEDSYEQLYSNIWHQGTVYEATAYAVPFLIELLGESSVIHKHEILGLLDSIANGSSYHDAHSSLALFKEQSQTEKYQHQMQIELGWVKQAYVSVREGLATYRFLLDDENALVRSSAAGLLATFNEGEKQAATVSAQALHTRFNREENPEVRIALIRSLGFLAVPNTSQTDLLNQLVLNQQEQPGLRQTAAVALALVIGEELPNQAVELLVKVIVSSEKGKFYDSVGNVSARSASNALYYLGAKRGVSALLRGLAGTTYSEAALIVVHYLLKLVFPEREQKITSEGYAWNKQGRTVREFGLEHGIEKTIKIEVETTTFRAELKANLTEQQRQVIAGIVAAQTLWELDTNLYLAYRLPDTREGLLSLL